MVSARSTDQLEVKMASENLPFVWSYPLLDVEIGPEGPIRQGNCILFGQHFDLKPGEKAEARLKVTFGKQEGRIAVNR